MMPRRRGMLKRLRRGLQKGVNKMKGEDVSSTIIILAGILATVGVVLAWLSVLDIGERSKEEWLGILVFGYCLVCGLSLGCGSIIRRLQKRR